MAVGVNMHQHELLAEWKRMLIIFSEQRQQTDGQNRGGDLHGALGEAHLRLSSLGWGCGLGRGHWWQGRTGTAAQNGGGAEADWTAGLGEVQQKDRVTVL